MGIVERFNKENKRESVEFSKFENEDRVNVWYDKLLDAYDSYKNLKDSDRTFLNREFQKIGFGMEKVSAALDLVDSFTS